MSSYFLVSLFLLGVMDKVYSWDTATAAVHERVKEFIDEKLEEEDVGREIPWETNDSITVLENRPRVVFDVLRCLHKSSLRNYWKPAFRYDPNPDAHLQVNAADRLDFLGCIHEGKKLLYVQVPKSASSTMKDHLKRNGFRPIHSIQQLPRDFHFNEYYTFTFVRNPITRFNAAYGTITAHVHEQRDKDYHDFVMELTENTQKFYASHHALPQTFFLSDENGLPYELDFIGKIENFDHDWKTLMRHIHIRPPPPQPKNVGEGHPHILTWLEERGSFEDQAAICNYYLSDFLCYEYEFPPFCSKWFGNTSVEDLVLQNMKSWSYSMYGVA